jgi:hypothetical protein
MFLVELDHVKSGTLSTPEMGRVFIEKVIFPTLARAEQLVKEEKILSGGPEENGPSMLSISSPGPPRFKRHHVQTAIRKLRALGNVLFRVF